MKKKLLSALVFLFCLAFTGSTFALEPDSKDAAPSATRSTLSVNCGLSSSGGSTYLAWASATSSVSETITVRYRLYRVVGSTLTLVSSSSSTATGTSAYVSKPVTLSAGSYRLVASATGSVSSTASRTRNYTIS
ncbi:MAG: hypothetical protein PHW41_04815 [Eubacteriales bacterium]|nr:hypothetical protein [Eubacteriales bacterium]